MTTDVRESLQGLAGIVGERSDAQSPNAGKSIVRAVKRERKFRRSGLIGAGAAVAFFVIFGAVQGSDGVLGDLRPGHDQVPTAPTSGTDDASGDDPLFPSDTAPRDAEAASAAKALVAREYPDSSPDFTDGFVDGYANGMSAGYASGLAGEAAPEGPAPMNPERTLRASAAVGKEAGYAYGFADGYAEGLAARERAQDAKTHETSNTATGANPNADKADAKADKADARAADKADKADKAAAKADAKADKQAAKAEKKSAKS